MITKNGSRFLEQIMLSTKKRQKLLESHKNTPTIRSKTG